MAMAKTRERSPYLPHLHCVSSRVRGNLAKSISFFPWKCPDSRNAELQAFLGTCGCGCAGENTREQLVAGGDGNDEGQKRARGVWSREAIE